MSARDKILRFAEENHNNLVDPWCDPETGYFIDDWQTHLGSLLDAFAHELAEEIREERDAMREEGKDPRIGVTRGMLDGMGYAADMIDPHPVRPNEESTT
ncbi:hypothetical protein [Streptomyces murinus]|uniref:hypothetical protein n=1 Tax=Streptomyces murinus TaxID=33900 RepID=UPI0018F27FC5|nr:hypothetical protein [Streptomyces murinus]